VNGIATSWRKKANTAQFRGDRTWLREGLVAGKTTWNRAKAPAATGAVRGISAPGEGKARRSA